MQNPGVEGTSAPDRWGSSRVCAQFPNLGVLILFRNFKFSYMGHLGMQFFTILDLFIRVIKIITYSFSFI